MIDFKNVSKNFAQQDVLRDVSLRVNKGERVGIVGPNGTGKTTVFSLISGEIAPDAGTVEMPRGVRIGYLHQQFSPPSAECSIIAYAESAREDLHKVHNRIEALEHDLHAADASERDALLAEIGELQTHFEASGGYAIRPRAETALCGLGFSAEDLERPFKQFSGGWQMRAELARVLAAEPDILLLDEPTNYLDLPAVEWLRKYLKDFPGTMVLVSHDRYLLNSLTTLTIEIANAQVSRYAGNYDFYVKERELRYEQQVNAIKNQARERERIERFINRFRSKNTKATQVQSKIKMLERMDETELPRPALSPGTIRLRRPLRSGQEVVRLEEAGFTYDGARWVLRGVDLRVQRGNRMAMVGLNGMGKTTLLRLLAGKLEPTEGKRVLGHKVVVGYHSQEFAETMDPARTVFEIAKQAGGGASEQDVRTLLGGFGFSGDAVLKKVAVLSGGEKVRLSFARLLVDPPNFLVLDEPTTHLDVGAREALERALSDFGGTICLVSHDVEFVRHVATGIIVMQPPGIQRYWGGYDYYREKSGEEPGTLPAPAAAPAAKPASVDRKAARRERAKQMQERAGQTRGLKAQVAKEEKRVEALNQEQEELLARVREAGRGADYASINRRLGQIQRELQASYTRWEDALTRLEEGG